MEIRAIDADVQKDESVHETRVWSGKNIPLATRSQALNALVVKPKSSGTFETEKLKDLLSMNAAALSPGPSKVRDTSYWNSDWHETGAEAARTETDCAMVHSKEGTEDFSIETNNLLTAVKAPGKTASNFLARACLETSPKRAATAAALRRRRELADRIAGTIDGLFRTFSLPAMVVVALITLLTSCVSQMESKVFQARAEEDLNKGELDSAQGLLHKSIRLNGANSTAYQRCSEISERRNELEKAFDYVSRALAIDPANLDLLEKKANIAVRLGWHQAVVDSYDRLFELNHGRPAVDQLLNRANSLVQLADYKNAMRDYACVLRSNPNARAGNAREGIALCYSKLGNDKSAILILDKILAHNSGNADAHLLRGASLQNLERFDQARAEFTWVIRHDPQNIDAHLALADSFSTEGKYERALQELQTAKLLAPADADVRLKTASLLLKMNKYEEAHAEYKATDKLSGKSENFEILSNRYKACLGAHHDGEAIAILNKLISLRPAQEAFYLDRAKAFARVKQYRKAIADCDNAFRLNPKNGSSLALRASFHSRLGEDEAALADYVRAVAVNPADITSNLNLADFQMTKLQFASAAETYKKALKIDPSSRPAIEGGRRARIALAQLVGRPASLANQVTPAAVALKELEGLPFSALLARGYGALKSNDLQIACTALKKAVQQKPNSAEARRYLAYTLLQSGEPQAAEEQFIALKVLGVNDPADQVRLAKGFMENGDPQKAIPILQHHIRHHGEDVDAALYLTEALLAVDDQKRARQVCAQALQNARNERDYARLKERYANLNNDNYSGNQPGNNGNNDMPASMGS